MKGPTLSMINSERPHEGRSDDGWSEEKDLKTWKLQASQLTIECMCLSKLKYFFLKSEFFFFQSETVQNTAKLSVQWLE